jgi:hypothetical protein
MAEERIPYPVRINRAKRAIAVPDGMSACLVTGTDKIRSGFGNGDCLLVDFQNRFFAVADGSDRWTTASMDFLYRLANSLSHEPRPTKESEWLGLVNTVYASQAYTQKTTFSGIAISREKGRQIVHIIHGGDSLIVILNLMTRKIEYKSCADMNFAGRTKRLSNVRSIPLGNYPYRVIIASDGLADLARLRRQGIEQMCADVLLHIPVHNVPEQLDRFLQYRKGGIEHDDIAIIVLNPEKMEPNLGPCLLIGGTSPRDERVFQEKKRNARIQDNWLDTSRLEIPPEELHIAGIRVVGRGTEKGILSQAG